MIDLDHGSRCDEHVGEAFRPRCAACDAAAEEHRRAEALGERPRHPGYCTRCGMTNPRHTSSCKEVPSA